MYVNTCSSLKWSTHDLEVKLGRESAPTWWCIGMVTLSSWLHPPPPPATHPPVIHVLTLRFDYILYFYINLLQVHYLGNLMLIHTFLIWIYWSCTLDYMAGYNDGIPSNGHRATRPIQTLQYRESASHIDGLAQDCSNFSALAMELLQSCTKPSI